MAIKSLKKSKTSKTEVETKKKKKKKPSADEDEAPAKKSKKSKDKGGKVEKTGKKSKTEKSSKKAGKPEKAGKGSKKGKPEKKVKKIIANEATPIQTKLNRSQTLAAVIEAADLQELFGKKFELSERLEAKVVKAVLAAQENVMLGLIHKKGAGTFTLGNLLKIVTKKVDAKPRRKGINPFTKEEQWFEAKPATVRVKARPMKRLKDAAL